MLRRPLVRVIILVAWPFVFSAFLFWVQPLPGHTFALDSVFSSWWRLVLAGLGLTAYITYTLRQLRRWPS